MKCEVCVDLMRLEHVSEFKYLGCVFKESGTDEPHCCRKVAIGRRFAVAFTSLFNARNLQLYYARALLESLLVPLLTYDSEKMIWI